MEFEKLIKALSDKDSKIYSIEFIKINYKEDGNYNITLCPKDCKEEIFFDCGIAEPNF
jgi:hypothetical protein